MSAHQRADPSRKLYFGVGLRFVAMINRAHCHGDACLQLTRGFCIGCFTRSFRDARGVGLAVCLPVRSRPWRVPFFFSLLRFDFVCCFVFRGGAYRREGGRSYYCKKKGGGRVRFVDSCVRAQRQCTVTPSLSAFRFLLPAQLLISDTLVDPSERTPLILFFRSSFFYFLRYVCEMSL